MIQAAVLGECVSVLVYLAKHVCLDCRQHFGCNENLSLKERCA